MSSIQGRFVEIVSHQFHYSIIKLPSGIERHLTMEVRNQWEIQTKNVQIISHLVRATNIKKKNQVLLVRKARFRKPIRLGQLSPTYSTLRV